MIGRKLTGIFLVFLCINMAIAVGPPAARPFSEPLSTDANSTQESYPSASWALGVVVPQGAGTADGEKVQWESVSNVTALVTLPEISRPDLPVYAVLSLMTEDSSVLQVAAGVFVASDHWTVYADFDTNVASVSPNYQQVLNASQPEMKPGDRVMLSVFRSSQSAWFLKVVDFGDGGSVQVEFPSGASQQVKVGDQEVFALESYSKNETTFENMGNLTLDALLVDGQRITGGFYTYGGWDPAHNPLYVVGSLATSPPLFISLNNSTGTTLVWSYASQWVGGAGDSLPASSYLPLPLVLGLSLVVVAGAFVIVVKNRANLSRRRRARPSQGSAS